MDSHVAADTEGKQYLLFGVELFRPQKGLQSKPGGRVVDLKTSPIGRQQFCDDLRTGERFLVASHGDLSRLVLSNFFGLSNDLLNN
jgi:hypothetical protein